jgi:ectoine hydroxylase-related dioxygenase (phytanoyl-CoA dioxygenase family)
MIDESAVHRYRENGYLVVRQALAPEALVALHRGVHRILDRWTAAGDSYERILLQVHQPWQQDAKVAELVNDRALADAARRLSGIEEVAVFLDQVIVKPPGGAATIAHQDEPFLSFDDDRSLGCWIALDTVTAQNGALAYFRGSHRLGPLPRIHLDEGEDLRLLAPRLLDFPLDIVEMSPGDAVFHNCRTVHQASANNTDRPRHAFSLQYMPKGARYNGYEQEFLAPYAPTVGSVLDQPCFAVPNSREVRP